MLSLSELPKIVVFEQHQQHLVSNSETRLLLQTAFWNHFDPGIR